MHGYKRIIKKCSNIVGYSWLPHSSISYWLWVVTSVRNGNIMFWIFENLNICDIMCYVCNLQDQIVCRKNHRADCLYADSVVLLEMLDRTMETQTRIWYLEHTRELWTDFSFDLYSIETIIRFVSTYSVQK